MEKKQYFALALSKKNKSELGYYNAILVPNFQASLGKYGRYVWYAGPEKWSGELPEIAGPLTLVMKKKYHHNVRSGSMYFYIISDKFLGALSFLKTNFKQIIEVSCVNKKGQIVAGERYYAAMPRKFFESECIDLTADSQYLKIKTDFNYDLFDIIEIPSYAATLICSGEARTAFESNNITGIDFIPLSNIKYPVPQRVYGLVGHEEDYYPV